MPTRYEEDTVLDAPDAGVREIMLKHPGTWSSKERKRMAQRMSVEDTMGLGNFDRNSVRFGMPGSSVDPGFSMPNGGGQPAGPPTHADALDQAGQGVWSGPRGGNQAFEDQQQKHGDYMRGIEDGSVEIPPVITTPGRELRPQVPGTNYRPNNPAIGLSEGEIARGASVRTPTPGGPGAYSVNQLPRGFTSYQNSDGGWTVIGTDGKAQRFANEQDAAAWLNGTPSGPTLTGAEQQSLRPDIVGQNGQTDPALQTRDAPAPQRNSSMPNLPGSVNVMSNAPAAGRGGSFGNVVPKAGGILSIDGKAQPSVLPPLPTSRNAPAAGRGGSFAPAFTAETRGTDEYTRGRVTGMMRDVQRQEQLAAPAPAAGRSSRMGTIPSGSPTPSGQQRPVGRYGAKMARSSRTLPGDRGRFATPVDANGRPRALDKMTGPAPAVIDQTPGRPAALDTLTGPAPEVRSMSPATTQPLGGSVASFLNPFRMGGINAGLARPDPRRPEGIDQITGPAPNVVPLLRPPRANTSVEEQANAAAQPFNPFFHRAFEY